MTQAAKVQEPSMEEILASIRRIISDDDATKSSKPAERFAASLEPSRSRQIPSRSTATASTSRLDANERYDIGAEAEQVASSKEASSESLLSNKTRATIDNAFRLLPGIGAGQNAPTLEDLVKDMLRPMLKSWLDDHLPGLVERLVRAEIERISHGR